MRIGLIAGSGQFPLIFSKAAKKKGYTICATAFVNETDPGIEAYADTVEWMHLGQLKRLIRFFKKQQVTEAVMMGAIRKTRIFTDIKPDMKAIAIITKLRHIQDDNLLSTFARVLEEEGIHIKASTFLVPELLAPEGCWTRRKPGRTEKADIDLGWRLAKEIGRLDIGQCVVVGGGSTLAVEAIDGTDETISRGGKLGNGNAVVVKVCKPNQDTRFDIPAVGTRTIETMYASGARILVVEAGRAIVFNRQEMIDLADRHDIAVLARKE